MIAFLSAVLLLCFAYGFFLLGRPPATPDNLFIGWVVLAFAVVGTAYVSYAAALKLKIRRKHTASREW